MILNDLLNKFFKQALKCGNVTGQANGPRQFVPGPWTNNREAQVSKFCSCSWQDKLTAPTEQSEFHKATDVTGLQKYAMHRGVSMWRALRCCCIENADKTKT